MVKQVILTEEEYNELVEKANMAQDSTNLDLLLQDERYIVLDMTKLKEDLIFSQTNSFADPFIKTTSVILKFNFKTPQSKLIDYIDNQQDLPKYARLKLIELYGVDSYNFIKQNED